MRELLQGTDWFIAFDPETLKYEVYPGNAGVRGPFDTLDEATDDIREGMRDEMRDVMQGTLISAAKLNGEERVEDALARERFKHHYQQFFKCSDEDADEAEESANLLIADGISPIDVWSTIYEDRSRRVNQMMNTTPIHPLTRSMYREQE